MSKVKKNGTIVTADRTDQIDNSLRRATETAGLVG